ncbi:MAG: hypothetical protein IAE78_09045 [Myxococcus sp.]|nr:hypothetical protein [Myxococcus sp.]
MLSALLAVVLSQPMPMGLPGPDAASGKALAPTALETARIYFIAGNLPAAREWGQRGLKREARVCKPLLKDLAEYSYLVSKYEPLTLEEARTLLALDKRISPKAVGKLTEPVVDRYVKGPLARASLWAEQGAAAEAVRFVDDVLLVDPANAEARALRLRLLEVADGGAPFDGGR